MGRKIHVRSIDSNKQYSDLDRAVNLSPNTYEFIKRTIGARSPEWGGLLGSSDGGKTIDSFVLDYSAKTTSSVYSPNVDMLNKVLAEWDRTNIMPVGIVHSHPRGCTVPSAADIQAATVYMNDAPAFSGQFELPIVQADTDGSGFMMYWYTAVAQSGGRKAHIVRRTATVNGVMVSAPKADWREQTMVVPEKDIFVKTKDLFPIDISRRKTIVAIGVGGSRSFLSQLARIGIGRFILIDGDSIEASNVATQGVCTDEIGLRKVDAAADELIRIDPYCKVDTYPFMFDNRYSDSLFEKIIGRQLQDSPRDVLICAFTDSFEANARAAALAVKYGTPFLQGLVYRFGRCAEIVFSYPGVTPACPRCCQTSRYEAYASGKVERAEDVSAGCPISATAILNAYKLEIAEELLFYLEDSPYKDNLDAHASNNLLLVRLSEELPQEMQGSLFDTSTSTRDGSPIIGGVFWDHITPDGQISGTAVCPLCGGSGNLLDSIGLPIDTRAVI